MAFGGLRLQAFSLASVATLNASSAGAAPIASSAEARACADQAERQRAGIRAAQGDAEREIRRLEDRAEERRRKGPSSAAIDRQIAEARNAIDELVALEVKTLDELRAGYYCSKCHHGKTEIEATGEPFSAHLERVHGHIVPASADEIDARRREFEAKIADARRRFQALQGERARSISQFEQALKGDAEQVRNARATWWQREQEAARAAAESARCRGLVQDFERVEREFRRMADEKRLREARKRAEEAARERHSAERELERARWKQLLESLELDRLMAAREDARRQHTPEADTKALDDAIDTAQAERARAAAQSQELAQDVGRLRDTDQNLEAAANAAARTGADSRDIARALLGRDPDELNGGRIAEQLVSDASPSSMDGFRDSSTYRGLSAAWRETAELAARGTQALSARAGSAGEAQMRTGILDALGGAPRPEEPAPATLSETISATARQMTDDLLRASGDGHGSWLGAQLRSEIAPRVTAAVTDQMHDWFLRAGAPAGSEGGTSVERAARDLELAMSSRNLFWYTFPFVGPGAARGVREFAQDVAQRLWRYFDLSIPTQEPER